VLAETGPLKSLGIRVQLVTALAVVLLAASCGTAHQRVAKPSPSPSTPSPTPSPSPALRIPPIPEGTYESHGSRADARRFHVKEQDIDENTGHFRLTFRAGRWKLLQTANHSVQQPEIEGIYTGSRHIVVLEWQLPATDTGTTTCRWRFEAKSKTLVLTVLRSDPDTGSSVDAATALAGDRLIFQSHPWRKAR
jgi:hypothetical protein